MASYSSNQIISTILKHDSKVTSYKIALLRAINDVVLAFPRMTDFNHDVAIPLQMLAQQWVAYYWPFLNSEYPIYQGQRAIDPRHGHLRNDISFRPDLTQFHQLWVGLNQGNSRPSDGFFLINELRIPRKRLNYPIGFVQAYETAVRSIVHALEMPIRHAGPGNWTVFARPQNYKEMGEEVIPIPGTQANDKCLVINADLWQSFQALSLWIEALCIHEWCLFTEKTKQDTAVDRGQIYHLLTDRPDNRRPLTWERNHIDILLMEKAEFICPWTEKKIRQGVSYDLDHIVPLSIYPTNELWNLVPSDPNFNSRRKRDRLPNLATMQKAEPYLQNTYKLYAQQEDLGKALKDDVTLRFAAPSKIEELKPEIVTTAVIQFVNQVGESRNLARF